MSENMLTTLATGVISDIPLCGGSIAGAITAFQTRQVENARSIILEEIKDGDFSNVDQDTLLTCLELFLSATLQGKAKLNLRLMAKLMNGLNAQKELYTEEFNRYAGILANLNRQQIIVITELYKVEKKIDPEKEGALPKLEENLVPHLFETKEEIQAILASTQMSGLVVPASGWGSVVYKTSPTFHKLITLVDFKDALKKG